MISAGLLVASLALTSAASATVDTLQIVLDNTLTTGGVTPLSAFAAFGYDPVNDVIYATGFSGTGQDIRIVRDVSSTPAFDPLVDRLVTNTPWVRFLKDGDLDRGGGAPTPGSMRLNPLPILNPDSSVAFPAYSLAVIADGGAQVTDGGTPRPDLSQRIYRYNLQKDLNADARDEMTSLVTTATLQGIAGATSASTNISRQPAFSSDGQSIFFIESSAAYGGLYRTNVLTGATTLLLPSPSTESTNNAEPAVIQVGGVDRVLLRGTNSVANEGGIDYFDTAAGTRNVLVAAQDLADFLEIPLTTTTGTTVDVNIDIASFASDDEGNVYFNNTDSSPDRRGIFKLDPQGRIIKVVGYAERKEIFGPFTTTGNPNNNTLRMQVREVPLPGGAAEGAPATINQVLYVENSPVNMIAGAYVFAPGDFNRDNLVTSVDYDLFGPALTIRGVAAPIANLKFDLNASGAVDWKDVKILQTFTLFPDGDTNFDGTVNFNDLLTLAQNYDQTISTRTWILGDFDGDDITDFDDLLTLAQNYVDSPLVVPTGFSNQFVTDWNFAQSLVPEPATLVVLGGVVALSLRRR
jgi:hypothetical protein